MLILTLPPFSSRTNPSVASEGLRRTPPTDELDLDLNVSPSPLPSAFKRKGGSDERRGSLFLPSHAGPHLEVGYLLRCGTRCQGGRGVVSRRGWSTGVIFWEGIGGGEVGPRVLAPPPRRRGVRGWSDEEGVGRGGEDSGGKTWRLTDPGIGRHYPTSCVRADVLQARRDRKSVV